MRRFSAILPVGSFLLVLTVAMNPSAQAQTFTVLHTFTGGKDGANPIAGLTLDNAGNLYGTAFYGGAGYDQFGYGTVYKLTHKGSGWTFNPLYSFAGGNDGESPLSRVTFGPDGSLYGTTGAGGE